MFYSFQCTSLALLLLNLFLNILFFLMLACVLFKQGDFIMNITFRETISLQIRFFGWKRSLELTFMIPVFSPFQFLVCILNLLGIGPCVTRASLQWERARMRGRQALESSRPLAFSGCVTLRTHLSCRFLICQSLELFLRIQWAK